MRAKCFVIFSLFTSLCWPLSAYALPGQKIEDAIEPANRFGWEVEADGLEAGGAWHILRYPTGKYSPAGKYFPLEGYDPVVDKYGKVVAEGTTRAIQISIEGGEDEAIAEWKSFLEDYFGEPITRDILRARALISYEERREAPGGDDKGFRRIRTALINGKKFLYVVTMTNELPEDEALQFQKGRWMAFNVWVYPLSKLSEKLKGHQPNNQSSRYPFKWPMD